MTKPVQPISVVSNFAYFFAGTYLGDNLVLFVGFFAVGLGSILYHWLPDNVTGNKKHRVYRHADEVGMYVVLVSILAHNVGLGTAHAWGMVASIAFATAILVRKLDSHAVLAVLGIIALISFSPGIQRLLCVLGVFAVGFAIRYLGEKYADYHSLLHPTWHVISSYGLYLMVGP